MDITIACQKILDSFATIQNPYSTLEARHTATEFVEELKGQRECARYIYHILGQLDTLPPEHADYVRFFSLKVLEDWTFAFWKQFPYEEQVQIRTSYMEMLTNNMSMFQSDRSMRIKLAKILAEIAKRQYPQYWDTFIHDICGLWGQDIQCRSEVCIMTLEFLVEDCVNSDFNSSLPAVRRNDILTSVKEQQSSILQYTFSFLSKHVHELYEVQTSLGLPALKATRKNECTLVNTTIRMLCPFASLASPEEMCADGSDFSTLIPVMLSMAPLQDQAAQMVETIVSHKHMSLDLLMKFLLLLPPAFDQAFSSYDDPISTEGFLFQRLLARSASCMLGNNITSLQEPRIASNVQLEETIKAYFGLLIKLLGSPSRRLALDVIKDVCRVIREESVCQYAWMVEVCTHLLSIYNERTVRVLWEEEEAKLLPGQEDIISRPTSTTEDENASIDFDDKVEYMDHFGNLRSNVRLLIHAIGTRYPQALLSYLCQKLVWLKDRHISPANSEALNDQGDCTYNSTAILEWDAYILYLDSGLTAVVQALETKHNADYPTISSTGSNGSSSSSSSVVLLNALQQGTFSLPPDLPSIADMLITLCNDTGVIGGRPMSDPLILLQLLRALKAMTPLLALDPNNLIKAFTTLFTRMNFGEENISDQSVAAHTTHPLYIENASQVRKMAGTVIANLSADCSDTLVATNLMDQLYDHAMKALLALTNPVQQTSMLETLVALSEKIEDIDRRREMYIQLLGETVQAIYSSDTVLLFQDAKTLLSCLEHEDGRKTFDRCINALSTFVSVSRRVGIPKLPSEVWTQGLPFSSTDLDGVFPFTKAWEIVIPTIIAAINALHQLWEPSIRVPLTFHTLPSDWSLKQNTYMTSPTMLASLYDAKIGGIGHTVASKQFIRCLSEIDPQKPFSVENSLGSVMYHLRYQLYQLIGLAASQKVLYVHPEHEALCMVIQSTSPYIDNKHMTQLVKYFVEPYLLNAHPSIHEKVTIYMSNFCTNMLERLAVCWSPLEEATLNGGGNLNTNLSLAASDAERMFLIEKYVYRFCGMEHDSNGPLTSDEIEAMRSVIITNLTKHYADSLMAVLCCRGFLATPLAVMKASNKGKKKGSGSNDGVDENEAISSINMMVSTSSGSLDDSFTDEKAIDDTLLDARKNCLLQLALGYESFRASFLSSTIAFLSIPDSTCAHKGLLMVETLTPLVFNYPQLMIPIGREAFRTLLGVLFRQEKWSKGMEWEILSAIEQIYTLIVPESQCIELLSQQEGEGCSSKHPRLPREVLLSLGVPTIMVETLEIKLRGVKNKKKKRDTLRDFLMEISPNVGGADLSSSVGANANASRSLIDVEIPPLHKKISQGRLTGASMMRRYVSDMATNEVINNEIIGNLFKEQGE